MHYEIGWHSSDLHCCHVALVDGESRDEIFDVALYQLDNDQDAARLESLSKLEELIAAANLALRGENA